MWSELVKDPSGKVLEMIGEKGFGSSGVLVV